MEYSESSSMREVSRNKCLLKERRKILNKQPNFTPKATRKKRNEAPQGQQKERNHKNQGRNK